jgi:hypothetical protein
MGTKKEPGKYDCHAKAELDEPLFTLLARDEHAPAVVRFWVAVKSGLFPADFGAMVAPDIRADLPEKLREALSCADAMQEWLKKNPRA